jgi:hypothetical protein
MGAEFSDRKKNAHHGVRPGKVLAEIERKAQSWRQPIVVNRKDLIAPRAISTQRTDDPLASSAGANTTVDRRHVVSSRLAAVRGDGR